ncbi:L-sulfolactate dehydrogenase [Methanococcus voltae]|uniref:L-2-hydroxycarboxylate dehydrogenase (NAD+) n=2 Tax=Methanococcus voltae TaxID=2188 RepID=A0A8J7UQS1_METVO|nr:L-sulfolactate dehydrogenase [Methanococcus voltae]MBP2171972.1 L-2-hydroxycarboxylate dehydrogenase (NAD+) [Methanococcus voltae]MBP2201073.1 L-2-hydroxycarboxylate dehydrogenase (NAD+) [Methanococcus voltae]MCS3921796.1 L-2-hydroxycarboxylate dehydrogenase (NAD+) [Methanococcus voltae PS]
MFITPENQVELLKQILLKYGVNEKDAKLTAEIFTEADLKGFTSHGIGRFHQTVIGLEAGVIVPNAEIKIEKESPATALINGNMGLGYVIGAFAMDLAIQKAKNIGIGMVSTYNANHFGITGHYSERAMKEGLIGLAITNTEPAMAPYGGTDKILGTNPVAIAIEGNETKFSLDMATASIARGKIFEADRLGKQLPENSALDKDGNPTNNPKEALNGCILPFGGIKGYGIATAIELLSALGGAAVGTNVKGTADPKAICTKGDLFLAINPEFFAGSETFKNRTDDLINELKGSKLLNGFDEILVAGEPEKRTWELKKDGYELDEKLYNKLSQICEKNNLDILKYVK